VCVNVDPGVREPPNEPSSAVTVWVTGSLFVQVTVLLTPMTTVMLAGLKAKPLMLTLAVLWATTVGAEKNARPPARSIEATRMNVMPLLVDFGTEAEIRLFNLVL